MHVPLRHGQVATSPHIVVEPRLTPRARTSRVSASHRSFATSRRYGRTRAGRPGAWPVCARAQGTSDTGAPSPSAQGLHVVRVPFNGYTGPRARAPTPLRRSRCTISCTASAFMWVSAWCGRSMSDSSTQVVKRVNAWGLEFA